jgi:polyphosphate kinase
VKGNTVSDLEVMPEKSGGLEMKPEWFINRELSWLKFNRRVLHEAEDERTPLLERVKFLGIFSSNLDEFFMKRVGGLKRQVAAGVNKTTPDGMTPGRQLQALRLEVQSQIAIQAECFVNHVRPRLAENGIELLLWEDLTAKEQSLANRYFQDNVFPILIPLAVDPGHPFPFISNLSLSLGVTLQHPNQEEKLFARIKVPEVLPQWIRLESGEFPGTYRFVSLPELIRRNLDKLFPDMVLVDVMLFRITRNADVECDEEDAEDLLELVEQEVRERRFARVVRLEHGRNPDSWMRSFLMQELELDEEDVYEMPAELDYQSFKGISELNLPYLKDSPFTPVIPTVFADEETDIFTLIRRGDLLVHHPYESFTASVGRFIRAAATDPKVLAIKMTVYRIGYDNPLIHTLIQAAEAGKQVVCLVELKARFDEERNIYWAQALERAGVHVVYGVMGLKTHSKVTLVVRQETDGLKSYAHIGTGNYHLQTTRVYTDLGLFTCDAAITEDLIELFHYLTGRSLKRDYRKLLVAPMNMKDRFLMMIEREAIHAKEGRPARIIAKMNSLEDHTVCEALYRASQCGVKIDLIIRGFCTLRPGIANLSENIRVISVIGRFLEHSRIFYFQNGCNDPLGGEFYIGSADWMYRNLLSRVEIVSPVEERSLRQKLWEIFEIMLADHRQAWELMSDGTYVQRRPSPEDSEISKRGTHATLIDLVRQRTIESRK